jgi:hypothetical protein
MGMWKNYLKYLEAIPMATLQVLWFVPYGAPVYFTFDITQTFRSIFLPSCSHPRNLMAYPAVFRNVNIYVPDCTVLIC